MQNAAVAQVFEDIADCLEIAGENVFKIRAYRRAAEAVATFPEAIEDALEAGTLDDIEGLGAATIAKTKEFLATGRVAELERLREQYPPGLLELLRVPGLGPKKIAQLYKERGISSIETLQSAIASGELKGLSGFGPKTIDNIAEDIRRVGEMSSQVPLGDALPAAFALVKTLQNAAQTDNRVLDSSVLKDTTSASATPMNVKVAGEIRRGCDTISQIVLVATDEDGELLQRFTQLPQVKNVVSQDDLSATIQVRPGIEARLEIASRDGFGSALFRATGSQSHIEEAEKLARERGVSLDDFTDETSLYCALGVDYIAPELRENKGEWQAAQDGKLPQLIEIDDIKGDLHAHSTWSDGTASIRQMVMAARARGYQYHAITDHSKALAMANGLDARRLREQAREIADVQAEFPDIKVLRGIECDIMRDGSLDLDDDILGELDWVVASVHSGFKMGEADQTERMIRAISHPFVNLVAHPTGRIVGRRPGYDVNIAELIAAAKEHSTALEINASERLDLRDEHAFMARQASVLLCIDTDAHSTRMLENLHLGILTARRAWCESQDVLNTKTRDELMAWLQRS